MKAAVRAMVFKMITRSYAGLKLFWPGYTLINV